jgi:hypothetical protein
MAELRRTPRIAVRNRLQGHLVEMGRPVGLRDFSLGGFSIETDEAIPDGAHLVCIQQGDRWSVTVTAESRHRQTRLMGDGTRRYIMGFEYADQSPATQQTIRILFERLAAEEP